MLTMFAEARQDNQWYKLEQYFTSTYEELEGEFTDRVYDGRDKQLISFLTAQSYGGMPDDASDDIKNHRFFQGGDIYYTTLKELLAFEWDKVVHKTGYISKWQYERLKKNGVKPANILNEPVLKTTPIVYPFQADFIIDYPSLLKGSLYVVYEYDHKPFYELCEFFCKVSIPSLIKLIPEGGTMDDVRIVFSIT